MDLRTVISFPMPAPSAAPGAGPAAHTDYGELKNL
jgi:hypothetical protein